MKKILLAITLALQLSIVKAAEVAVTAVPTGWTMESAVGGAIDVYYTGTNCSSGRLFVSRTISEEEKTVFGQQSWQLK